MTTLASKQYGTSGPVLIILHGLFGNAKNWHNIATSIADNYLVYCLDLRNHGQSFHHNSMSYSDMADDVIEFMNARLLTNANFIGHSMGGKVLMTLALLFPQKIKKMIVVDIAPVNYPNHFNQIISAIEKLPLHSLKDRQQADHLLANKIPEQAIRQFLLMNLRRQENGCYQWQFNINSISNNIDNIIEFPESYINYQYPKECYFLAGENSDYIDNKNKKAIKHFFPQYKFLKVKKAGHWLHAEQPTVLVNMIKNIF